LVRLIFERKRKGCSRKRSKGKKFDNKASGADPMVIYQVIVV
jgi:hypothetical protein